MNTRLSTLIVCAGTALALPCLAHAAVITWNNGNNNNVFTEGGNWAGGTAPGADDEAVINSDNAAPKLTSDWTLSKLKLEDKATVSATVRGAKLTTGLFGVSKGKLLVHGEENKPAEIEVTGLGAYTSAGTTLTLDAPDTKGDVRISGSSTLKQLAINERSTLQVNEGKGGKRSLGINLSVLGTVAVDHDLVMGDIRGAGFDGRDMTVTVSKLAGEPNPGLIKVKAGKSFTMLGAENAKFKITGGKIQADKGKFSLQDVEFIHDGGKVRNAADNDVGRIDLKACSIRLNSGDEAELQINGDKSKMLTGIPGLKQVVTWDSAGVNADLVIEVPADAGATEFANKGRMNIQTQGKSLTVIGQGAKSVISNSGGLFCENNGSVRFKDINLDNKQTGNIYVRADTSFETSAADAANVLPKNNGHIYFGRDNATLSFNRKLMNHGGEIAVESDRDQPKYKNCKLVLPHDAQRRAMCVGGKIALAKGVLEIVPPSRPAGEVGVINDASRSSFITEPTLTLDGGWEMESDSTLEVGIEGLSASTYDIGLLSVVNADCLLNGSLTVFLGGVMPMPGQQLQIVTADAPVTGQFIGGLSPDGFLYPVTNDPSPSVRFEVAYNHEGSYGVTLITHSVPTPGTGALLSLALGMISRRRR